MNWEHISFWIEHNPGLASWVQSVGSIAAIIAAIWIARRDSRLRKKIEKDARIHALVRAITVVNDAGARVCAGIKAVEAYGIQKNLMGNILADMALSQQHLKEAVGTQGIDSGIYTELFQARTAVEDAKHMFQILSADPEGVNELIKQLHPALDKINKSLESLTKLHKISGKGESRFFEEMI